MSCRWFQEIDAAGAVVFLDIKDAKNRRKYVSRSMLVDEGAFLWAPWSEEENRRGKEHVQNEVIR